MTPPTYRIAAAAAVGALILSACSDSDPDPDPVPTETQPTTEAPSPTEPVTETPPVTDEPTETETVTDEPTASPEEEDEAEVLAALENYLAVLDEVGRGEAEIEAINEVAFSTARDIWVTQATADRELGWVQEGSQELLSAEITVEGEVAEVTGCLDVSAVDVKDENGDSIVADTRLDRTVVDYLLERNEAALGGWYVIDDESRSEPCDG